MAHRGWTLDSEQQYIEVIGPAFNTGGAATGNYSYQLSVDLTGYDPRTAFLAGSWAADDTGSIFLNGVDTGFWSTNYFVGFSTFTLTNGFVLGTNLIEFRISNAASPTGLRVETYKERCNEKPCPSSVPSQKAQRTALATMSPSPW